MKKVLQSAQRSMRLKTSLVFSIWHPLIKLFFWLFFLGVSKRWVAGCWDQPHLKVVNCTQLGALMRQVGDRCPESGVARPSKKPPPPRGVFGARRLRVPS